MLAASTPAAGGQGQQPERESFSREGVAAPAPAGGHHHASGSAIRKKPSHQQAHPSRAPRQLQGQPAGGPARALATPSQPSALSPQRRPLPAPPGSEQGATGGFARRASGTLPQITRPKTGKSPWWFEVCALAGFGRGWWCVGRVCRSGCLPALDFLLPPVERSEGLQGRVGGKWVALHLCCLRVNLGQSRPTAPTGSHPAGVA